MPLITKLTYNSLGWTKPSGKDGKCNNTFPRLFEETAGFGFEEWLFKESHKSIIDSHGYYFGFLQALEDTSHKKFLEEAIINGDTTIYLFTKMYKTGNVKKETQRLIGSLEGIELISELDLKSIAKAKMDEWYKEMKKELKICLKDDVRLIKAIERFEDEYHNKNLFNIKFKRANRYDLPTEKENWDYLNRPKGVSELPEKFTISTLPQTLVQSMINDQGHIPQLLGPISV